MYACKINVMPENKTFKAIQLEYSLHDGKRYCKAAVFESIECILLISQ